MAQTLHITKADLDADNFYIGSADASDWQGSIEIAANLGTVRFRRFLRATGRIVALAGSGIEAGSGIKAGLGIEAGEGIKAGLGIEAGLAIECRGVLRSGLRIFAGLCIWRRPSADEMTITCGRLKGGEVCFGTLVETEKQHAAE